MQKFKNVIQVAQVFNRNFYLVYKSIDIAHLIWLLATGLNTIGVVKSSILRLMHVEQANNKHRQKQHKMAIYVFSGWDFSPVQFSGVLEETFCLFKLRPAVFAFPRQFCENG